MLEEWAAAEAEHLLSPLGDRWNHVRAVGERAGEVGAILGQEDRRYLISAAYLHDIGYAPDLSELVCISSMAAFKDRVTEVEQRYGEGEIVDALRQATPYLLGAIERTEDRLRQRRWQPRSDDDRTKAALKVVPDPDAD